MKKSFTAPFLLALVLLAPAVHAAEIRAVTFDDAVKLARENNPNSQKANVEVRRLQAVVEETRAVSLPTLSFNAQYTLLDADRKLPPPSTTVISAQNQIFGSLLFTVPIVNAAGWAKWSHAAENVDVQKLTVADTNRQVIVSAAHAYLTVFSLKRLLEVSITARDNAKAHYDYAHTRVSGGVGNKLDEARAMSQLGSTEVQVQGAIIALDRAREALGVLAGVNEPLDVKEEPRLDEKIALPAALQDAENQRADVKLARGQLTAARHVERDSWTDYMPLVGLVFEPFYQNPASLTFPETGWQLQALLTFPIFDGGFRYGTRKERTALVDEARIAVDATLRQASSEVRVAYSEVRTADDAVKAAHEAETAANHALELATLAYEAGAITNLDVIDAQRQARDAATLATIAEDTARQARLDLLAATGKFP